MTVPDPERGPAATGPPTSAVRGEPATADASANWVWLADLARDRALLMEEWASGLADALSRQFAAVERCAPPGTSRLNYADAWFDCVVAYGAPEQASGHTLWLPHLWPECRRVLRPAGCLVVAAPNPLWYSSATHAAGRLAESPRRPFRAPHFFRGALRDAGFRTISVFYVEDSLANPLAFVPGTRRATAVYEAMRPGSPRLVRLLRLAAARAGLHHFLYPFTLTLAYR